MGHLCHPLWGLGNTVEEALKRKQELKNREKGAVKYYLLGIPPSNTIKNSEQLWLPAVGLNQNIYHQSIMGQRWAMRPYTILLNYWLLMDSGGEAVIVFRYVHWWTHHDAIDSQKPWSQRWPRLNWVSHTTKQTDMNVRTGNRCRGKIKVGRVKSGCSIYSCMKLSKKKMSLKLQKKPYKLPKTRY